MKKRLSALILAMLMILSICPVAMATAEYKPTIAKTVIYDAHITGNFVVGGTLTAEYSYTIDETHTQLNVANTDATITWYNMDRYGSGTDHINKLGTGKTYTIPEDYLTTYANNNTFGIFFTVTATDGSATPVAGNTFHSHFYYQPVAAAAEGAAEAPEVWNVGIVPQNPEGTMNVGDTVVARYTYRETTGAKESGTTFAWYTRDGVNGERSTVLGRGETYQIKESDFGKILEVDVTPVTENNTTGTTVTAMNHVSNLFFSKDAVATLTGFRGYSKYREELFLANGSSVAGTGVAKTISGSMLCYGGVDRAVVFDMGKITPVDGLYLSVGNAFDNFNIYTSGDGTNWGEPIKTAAIDTADKYEILFDSLIYTRYLKVSFDCKPKTYNEDGSAKTYTESTIYDMYPYLSGDKWISCDEAFAYASAGKLEVTAWNTPGNVIISNLKASPAATLAITDADGNTVSDDFTVTETLSGKYVKVTGTDGRSALHEIIYAGDIVEETDNEVIVTSTSDASKASYLIDTGFAGDDNGKYLFSAKVYVPDGCDVRLGVYLGGNAWNKASYQQKLMRFTDTDNALNYVISTRSESQHSFIPGKWYDVDIILDYSSWNGMEATGKMNYSCWVDGVEIKKTNVRMAAVTKFTNDYICFDLEVTAGGQTAKAEDISFRKLWNQDDFVAENSYALSLKSGGETVTGALTAGKTYSVENNIGVYDNTINSFTNFLAVYDVTYDTDNNVISAVLADVVTEADSTVTIAEPVTNDDNTVTKQEVRAFCFSDTLVPLLDMGEWK